MTLLLDTHVLIWLVEGVNELSPASRERLEEAAASEGLAVSAISFWEVGMLAERGRLSLARPAVEWRRDVLALPGLVEVPVTGDLALESVRLPGQLHADPADRLLVATARVKRCTLVTRDVRLLRYSADGHVATLPA